jgi:FAD/FMN-containing dehydrogenase
MNLIEDLRAIVGADGVLDADEVAGRQAGIWRRDRLVARALVRPSSTEDVAAVLRYCHAHRQPVVTHGGLTGLVHGADAAPDQLILSLERMRAIERVDPVQRVAVAQAGVTLQAVQEAAEAHGLSFPLDLGGRGSATIGGNASTNAGGNRVIRYGMTRDMVFGLEAVLADGTVVSSLNSLIKNNAGYDLKQLFIGTEGTLGVITRLVLRLREKPTTTNMAFAAFDGFDRIPAFLKHMDRRLGGTLSAFEVMWRSFYLLVTTPPAKGKPPVGQNHPYYVLVESQGSDRELDTRRFNAAMETALDEGLIVDAAIAQSDADCHDFWSLRDDVGQIMVQGTPAIFDVSLPIAEMERFTRDLDTAMTAAIGAHRLYIFGHLGDGNLHLAVPTSAADHAALRPKIEEAVYRGLAAFRGSVSAEHGIGLEKKPWLSISRTPEEIALMRTIKAALDPLGLLNPGKVF